MSSPSSTRTRPHRTLLLGLGLTAWSAAPSAVSALSEMDTLIRFYNLANGRHWVNSYGWAEASKAAASGENIGDTEYASVCSWYGVTCKAKEDEGVDTVESIDLSYNHMSGKVSHHLWTLPNLKVVNLHGNLLTDAGLLGFADDSSSVKSPLEKLMLSENRLSSLEGLDSVPSSLKHLHVGSNAFEGHFPEQILRLHRLHTLRASYNAGIVGTIPPEIGSMAALRQFELSYTGIKGTIPTELGQLSNLEYLSLDNNRFHGDIPFELGDLIKLKYLSIQNGEPGAGAVKGPLPTFKDSEDLKELYLNGNSLTGHIPFDFLEFSHLKAEPVSVDLRNNKIWGKVPAELASFDLLHIELGGNKINNIPDTLCQKQGWMTGAVEEFGCDGILCPRGTFRPGSGRREGPDDSCKPCPNGMKDAPHLGSLTCDGGPSTSDSISGGKDNDVGVGNSGSDSAFPSSSSTSAKSGLGGGAILGITIVSLVSFLGLLLLVRRRYRRRKVLREMEAQELEKAAADGGDFGSDDAATSTAGSDDEKLDFPLDVPGINGANRCIL